VQRDNGQQPALNFVRRDNGQQPTLNFVQRDNGFGTADSPAAASPEFPPRGKIRRKQRLKSATPGRERREHA